MAVAYLYVDQSYRNTTKGRVQEMIYYLKKAFEEVIVEQAWLPESFKDDLVDKVYRYHICMHVCIE
jgi:predicted metalloendopeptidase